ncbi:MAG: RluA family pseudouridine synthase, partial [Verrucomicrobia bacterium]|nr:RluA family pseudouridine synthase [Verrucomicrobiota bacterium]
WTPQKEQTLLEALQTVAPDSSKTTLRSWIAEGRILVDGVVVKDPRVVVKPSMNIELAKKRQYLFTGIEILYQDEHIVVVYKPPGMLSVPTETDLLDNLHEHLKRHFKRRTIYPVHRLDREASGVIIFAFTEEAQEKLKSQFEEHSILREYLAVVEGNLTPRTGTWQSYLLEDGTYYVRSVADISRGKIATTHYEVIGQKGGFSTLKVTLETGRKNQIRVHTSEAGFSILGDKKYRSTYEFHDRVALQACKLGISHPITLKPLLFTREPDPEFAPFIN